MIKFTCRGIPLLLMIAICYLLSFRLYLITSYTFLFWTGLVTIASHCLKKKRLKGEMGERIASKKTERLADYRQGVQHSGTPCFDPTHIEVPMG